MKNIANETLLFLDAKSHIYENLSGITCSDGTEEVPKCYTGKRHHLDILPRGSRGYGNLHDTAHVGTSGAQCDTRDSGEYDDFISVQLDNQNDGHFSAPEVIGSKAGDASTSLKASAVNLGIREFISLVVHVFYYILCTIG